MSDLSAIFKAYDVRGKVGTELNAATAIAIGKAFGDWLPTEGPVAVGRDMRPDSAELANELIAGLVAQGRDVVDIGLVTSDMSYFAVGFYKLAGAAMVTASHNPGEYNGIKLYRDNVIPVGLDSGLDAIRDAVLTATFKAAPGKSGSTSDKDITEDWVQHCLTFLCDNPKDYKLAVDAGNGMAGAIFPELEPYVPWEVTELFFELDGTFPNHEANPQKPENLKELARVVLKKKLDFGIAFDGDGDRAAFVDDKGRPVNGTDLITIVARYYLQKYPSAEIVHEVRTSRATKELIVQAGGRPYRTKAGRVSIGAVMRERQAPFGGETTGHLFFKENYYADSGLIGAIVAISALQASGKKLSALVDECSLYSMMTETNFEVQNKETAIQKVAEAYRDGEVDWLDGLTVDYDDWWFNLRPSNTEPVLRLNAEATTKQLLEEKTTGIKKILLGS